MKLALLIALALGLCGPARGVRLGLEMPAAGIDGGSGLAVRLAVRLAGVPIVDRDSASGGFANPHQDEGVDNDVDVLNGPTIIAGFAEDSRIVAAIGGLRRRAGDADAAAARAGRLPVVVLARWSRNSSEAAAYCVCASPSRLVSFVRAAGRKRFGPRLLLVLLGDAAALEPIWNGRWGPVSVATVSATAGTIAKAQRRAGAFDAVLVVADERPPTLWRATAFRRFFNLGYVRRFGHRDFEAIPSTAPAGDVAIVETQLAQGAARAAFERRFHAAAGYRPSDAATRAYAAAQILTAAGTSRARIGLMLATGRFVTVAGGLRFDADGYSRPYPSLALKS
jgi:hypothetical protein